LQLVNLIKREAVFFRFDTGDKEAILDEMIRASCAAEGIDCLDEVHQAVFEREADRSTGIGRGLAVPHCRADDVRSFHVSVAVLKDGVDWDALDDRPVHFIFLVIGPADQPEAYLQLLSQISRLIRLPQATKRLLAATTPEEVIATIDEL
jgi:mannitol/fructose-specific phosphotransferase system IIA component (Ntr-type)